MPFPETPTPPAPAPGHRPLVAEVVAPTVTTGARRRGGSTRRWLIPLAAFLILAAGLLVPRFATRLVDAPPNLELARRGRLAILPFVYRGADAKLHDWIGQGLMEMVAQVLAATRGLDVVPPDGLRQAIAERALDPASEISRARILQLGLALGAELALEATIERQGELYAIDYRILGADGELARAVVEGESLFEASEKMTRSVAVALDPNATPPPFHRIFSASPFLSQLYGMGLAELYRGGPEKARPYFVICFETDPRFQAARLRLAESEQAAGRLEPARELYLATLREAEDLGERSLQTRALIALGDLAAFEGRYHEADELLAQADALLESFGDRGGRMQVLGRRARIALTRGEHAAAQTMFFDLLQLQVDAGDRIGEAATQLQLGALALAQNDLDTAQELFERARQLAKGLDDVRTEMRAVASLGEVADRRGDPAEAEKLWAEALAFYRQRGELDHELLLTRKLAEATLRRGDLKAAEDAFANLLDLAEKAQDPALRGLASLRLAWILLRAGYPYQARTHLERALENDRAISDPLALQRTIAWLAYEEGNYRLAVETQRAARELAGEAWEGEAQAFLETFEKAAAAGKRLPLPVQPGG